MKSKYHIISVIVLMVVLVLIFSFFVYEGMRTEEIPEEIIEEDYIAEEIVEEKEVVPNETGESPTIEETEKEVEVLNEVTIIIHNGKFYPDKITISPGTTIIWDNEDSFPHKLVAYDRLFYSPRLQPGDKYAFTFTQEGIHRYFDAIFPKAGKGSITVKEEPLPITGGVVGIDLDKEESDGKFALLVLLFAVMVFGLSHGMYKHYRI